MLSSAAANDSGDLQESETFGFFRSNMAAKLRNRYQPCGHLQNQNTNALQTDTVSPSETGSVLAALLNGDGAAYNMPFAFQTDGLSFFTECV